MDTNREISHQRTSSICLRHYRPKAPDSRRSVKSRAHASLTVQVNIKARTKGVKNDFGPLTSRLSREWSWVLGNLSMAEKDEIVYVRSSVLGLKKKGVGI